MRSLTDTFEGLSFSWFDLSSFLRLAMEESAVEHLLSVAGDQAVSGLLRFEQVDQLPSISVSLCNREHGWTISMSVNVDPWQMTDMNLYCQSRYQANSYPRELV